MDHLDCDSCGHRNTRGSSFCANCDAFLDWDEAESPADGPAGDSRGRRGAPPPVAAEAEGAAATAAAPEPVTGPLPTPAVAAPAPAGGAGGDPPAPPPQARTAPGAGAGPDSGDSRGSVPLVAGHPVEAAPRPADPLPPGPPRQAAPPGSRPPVTAAEVPSGGDVLIRPRQPERARSRPVPVADTTAELPRAEVADACDRCSTRNGPERRFCRRCGASLVEGVPERVRVARPSLPWWRRLLAGDPDRPNRALRAAYRRTLPLRYRLTRVAATLAVLGLVTALVAVAGRDPVGWARGQYHELRDTLVPVDGVTASVEAAQPPGSDAAAAVDGNTGTAWATRWPAEVPAEVPCGAAPGDALVLQVEDVVDVRGLRVVAGLPEGDPDRPSQRRPAELEVRTREGTCVRLPLADDGRPQTVRLPAPALTTGLRIAVSRVHGQATPSELVSLTEVGVLRRPS